MLIDPVILLPFAFLFCSIFEHCYVDKSISSFVVFLSFVGYHRRVCSRHSCFPWIIYYNVRMIMFSSLANHRFESCAFLKFGTLDVLYALLERDNHLDGKFYYSFKQISYSKRNIRFIINRFDINKSSCLIIFFIKVTYRFLTGAMAGL